MIAVDTNILIYAHRPEPPFHTPAKKALEGLMRGAGRWAVPWPCVHEFIGVVTRPSVFKHPTSMQQALEAIRVLYDLDGCDFLAEGDCHFDVLVDLALTGKITGAAIHDARIAALCLQHGVSELWSADRDFGRFPRLKVINPLFGSN